MLLVVPSDYTFGSFAVTPAMVVGILAGTLWLGGLVLPDPNTAYGGEPHRRGVLVFVGLVIVSYLVAMLRPLESATADADRRLVGLLSVVGVALLAADGIRARHEMYRVLGAMVAAGGAVALIGILQYVAKFDLAPHLRPPGFAADPNSAFVLSRAGLDRVAGTTRHPIEFGVVCALLLPIALHLSAHTTQAISRRASMLAAALLGLALPMALSRAAVVAAAVAIAIMLPGLPAARRWKLVAGIGAVMLSITVLAPGVLTTVRELFIGGAAAGSNEARAQATDAAIDLFTDEPWLGHGFGTLQDIIVDNQLLVTAVESGVLGVVGLLVLANGAILSLRTARHRTMDAALNDLGLSLIAVIVAVVIGSSGLATLVYPVTSGLLFLTIGLAGALHRIASDGLATVPRSDQPGLVPTSM